MARKQWRCFHCDEVFTNQKFAAQHFGYDGDVTACKIVGRDGHLIAHIRKLEDQLVTYRSDDSDIMRAMLTMEADHRQALIRAEEAGYIKGVRDIQNEMLSKSTA